MCPWKSETRLVCVLCPTGAALLGWTTVALFCACVWNLPIPYCQVWLVVVVSMLCRLGACCVCTASECVCVCAREVYLCERVLASLLAFLSFLTRAFPTHTKHQHPTTQTHRQPGTGKSAAILCSVLAWQRHHYNATGGETVKILYCSRTHSQVTQMVASLQQTPYRPAMTVLGSRDRMCIHHQLVRPSSSSSQPQHRTNLNNECRNRVRATEASRKSPNNYGGGGDSRRYTDHNPPTHLDSDDYTEPMSTNGGRQERKPTCPHYRQLGATHTAESILATFRPEQQQEKSSAVAGAAAAATAGGPCLVPQQHQGQNRAVGPLTGNESTKLGTHDIEDLVQFGRNPYKRTVVLRKRQSEEGWGMKITMPPGQEYPTVVEIIEGGNVHKSASVRVGDQIFAINGVSTAHRSIHDLDHLMVNSSDKLVLQAGSSGDKVHPHSACPYYISRALEKHAELVLCPYNYILDPSIREALGIDLEGTVVVLDEAHNVEDTLRGSGSGQWSEMDLCGILHALQFYVDSESGGAVALPATKNKVLSGSTEKDVRVNEMAHELVLFVETILLYLLDHKRTFEERGEARRALEEWEKFHTPDTKAFETSYDGPTGYGVRNQQVGCANFFDKICVGSDRAQKLVQYAESMLELVQSHDDKKAALDMMCFEKMVDMIGKLAQAMLQPQHYFIQSTVQPNGSFEFASGQLQSAQRSRQRKPKVLPKWKSAPCRFCRDTTSGHEMVYFDGSIQHGSYNTGETPPWESFLVLELLSPAQLMKELAKQCRSLILASGSLAPLPSLCAELGLLSCEMPPDSAAKAKTEVTEKQRNLDVLKATIAKELRDPVAEAPPRLQTKPPPLEADHVINLEKQLLAVAVGNFPDGEKLTVNYGQYKHDTFIHKLGGAIASVIECIPRGGVLVFLPSYSLLRKCEKIWNPDLRYNPTAVFQGSSAAASVWERLHNSKGKVIVEPTGTQTDFEAARDEYASAIRETGNCVLLAVFRGKMSEGISFNDDNARGVICVGIPFPNSYERSIIAKRNYNDEQRKLAKRTDVLDGSSWYSQQAFRAIAQALGRCIRHAGDYGTVILVRRCSSRVVGVYCMC
jgi:Rad3-related DNA helicase